MYSLRISHNFQSWWQTDCCQFFLFLVPVVITFAVTSPTSSAVAPTHEAIWWPSFDHVWERRGAKMQTEIEGVMEGVWQPHICAADASRNWGQMEREQNINIFFIIYFFLTEEQTFRFGRECPRAQLRSVRAPLTVVDKWPPPLQEGLKYSWLHAHPVCPEIFKIIE